VYSKSPVGHIWISRELVMAPHSQVQISSNILEAEKTLQNQLPEGSTTTTLSSWIQIIQASIQVLNSTSPMNVTHCFLCASLQRSPLAAVPVNLSKPTLTSIPDTPTHYSPLPSIPLWEPEPDQHPLPFCTCYFTQHSTLKAGLHGLCHSNISVTSQIFPPSGLSF
jgi:hypothetical protein